jgi:hypothetical protein
MVGGCRRIFYKGIGEEYGFNIELMKKNWVTSWKLIKRIFQISFVVVQQI